MKAAIKLFNECIKQSNKLPADSPESESRVFDYFVDFYFKGVIYGYNRTYTKI